MQSRTISVKKGVSSHCGSFRVRIRVKIRVALMTEEEKVEFRVWWLSVVTMETRQNQPKINENGIPTKNFFACGALIGAPPCPP